MFISMKIRKLPLIAFTLLFMALAGLLLIKRAPNVSGSEERGLRVPIIMYHSISPDESRFGEYGVSPQLFEEDIIYLKQQGYEAITVNELIMHTRYGSPLPEKPVIITLDDAHLNVMTRALPIIKKHGFKMTISCVGEWTKAAGEEASPDESFSYCDLKDIEALRKSSIVEIACHSFDMHSLDGRRGILRAEGETAEEYRSVLFSDILKAQKLFKDSCGFEPNVYTYPYGFYDEASAEIIKSAGFEATLTCEEGVNYIENEASLYGLKRFNRPYGQTSEEFFKDRLG